MGWLHNHLSLSAFCKWVTSGYNTKEKSINVEKRYVNDQI